MAAHQSITTASEWVYPPDPYANNPFSIFYILFRPIPDFFGYAADTDGNIWTCRKSRPVGSIRFYWLRMRPSNDRRGHLYVGLRKNCQTVYPYVHNLVLETFVGPRLSGLEACHFPDRDPANNHLWNLRWDTKKANSADRLIHGTDNRGIKHNMVKLTEDDVVEIRRLWGEGIALGLIADRFGISRAHAHEVATLKSWQHIGKSCESVSSRPSQKVIGSRHRTAKLSEPDIPKIRELFTGGMPQVKIALLFGVSRSLISAVTRGEIWTHV